MDKRKIAPVEINGKTIWMEVSEIEMVNAEPASSSEQHPKDLRRGATPVGPKEVIQEAVADAGEMMEAVVGMARKAMEKVSPDEVSVELTLGVEGKKGIPFVAEGSASGGVKVTAKWVKKEQTP